MTSTPRLLDGCRSQDIIVSQGDSPFNRFTACVPEVWRYAEQTVILYRHEGQGYGVMDACMILTGMHRCQLTQFVQTGYAMPRPAWLRSVRTWVKAWRCDPPSC